MHPLLKLQLKKIYGKDFDISKQDEKFQKFITLIENGYRDFEENESFLNKILEVNAKELEESNYRLYRKQELLRSVKNSMDDAIFYKDLNHRYIGCNEKFAEFLGLSEEEMIGKSDYDFFDKKTADYYREMNEEIIQNQRKIVYKQWVDFHGKKVYALTSKTALVDKNKKVIGVVGVSRDITHEYEMQKELEHKNIILIQQNKLVSMGEMIANIAHQWRQPLNTLSLVLQKLQLYYKEDLLDTEKMDQSIYEAMELIHGMSETIEDFRNFFKPAKAIEEFSLEDAIEKSYIIIKPVLEKNNITLTINVPHRYFIKGYKNEFFQVILNLLNNAVEALIMDNIKVPIICINVWNNADDIVIEVYDNANGIKGEDLDRLFDPYFTTKESGTGLGLYMSRIIIEEHMHGELSVKSNYLGTTFLIKLGGVFKLNGF